MGSVQPVPEGYEGVTPYICVHDGAAAIEFYKQAFGATELLRMEGPPGVIGHAEVKIGGGIVMLSDESPEIGVLSPKTLGGSATGLMFYVPDCDAVFAQAVAAGAEVLRPLADQFYGDRTGQVLDPFGHKWSIATHIEDVPPDEMDARAKAFMEANPM